MKIDPRHLRYLRAIDTHGTFIRAAEAEGISQPALTNKIGILEQQLGVTLIERGRFGARLNAYGKLLLRHARAIDAVLGQAVSEIELAQQGQSGPLIIGATPISMIELIPKALERLDKQNASLRVSVIEEYDDLLLDKLHAGEVDVMIGGLLVDQLTPDVVADPLISLPLEAVVGRSSALWDRNEVSLAELLEHSWALPASGSVIRSYVDAIFVAAGESMTNQYWTCTGLHGLKSMIRKTERVSLMPGHAFRIEAKAGELKGLRLTDPTSSRKLNLLRLKHIQLPPYADLFIDALHAAAEDHVWV